MIKKVSLVFGLILIGAALGGSASLYYYFRMSSNGTVLDQSNDMMNNTRLLKQIRAGETAKAAESIESSLDGNLIFFAFEHKVNPIIEHRALEALKEAREYRKQYFRTTNDKELDATINKALSRNKINGK